MTYLYILLMFVLLPIRMVFAFIAQIFWFPSFKSSPRLIGNYKPTDEDVERLVSTAQTQLDEIANDGDGPKFLSLYHLASRYYPEVVPSTDHMYKFYHEDKTFKRYENLEDNIGTPTPSGDMMAGYVLARAADTNNNIKIKAQEYVSIIKNVINNKIPFAVPHPNGETWGRGFIWPLWGDGADVLKCVAMIDSAIETKKLYDDNIDWHLQFVKYLILITNFPLWIWSHDSAFFVGNVYFVKWFGPHSRMMYATAGYILTQSWYYRLIMKRLYKKYGDIIPDIAYLYRVFVDIKADVGCANYMIKDYVEYGKGTYEYVGPTKTYINVERLLTYPFKKEEFKDILASQVLPARVRCETYIWERDPLKFKMCKSGKRQNCIDIIMLLAMSKINSQK